MPVQEQSTPVSTTEPQQDQCGHNWIIEPANGPASLRVCSNCEVLVSTVDWPTMLIPLNTYAESVGMTLSNARSHVQVGKVDAIKVGNRWFVPVNA